MSADPHETTFDLGAGRLCLDFANTANWHASANPVEMLNSYADLVSFSRQAGVVNADQADRLLREAARRPADADAARARAIMLREAIYRVFSALAAESAPAADDLALLNAALPEALARLRITAVVDGFTWAWRDDPDALDQMLGPILWSAGELLTSDELSRVRKCADDNCGWLFVDTSRNRSRRWCSMESCGNRAKARRFYTRKQKEAAG